MTGAGGMLYAQAAVNGLLVGGLYLVIAIGLSLIFGVMDVINLAHGSFVAVGAYTAYTLQSHFGWDPYASIPAVFVALAVLGWLTEMLLIRRVKDQLLMAIVTLFGLALLLENGLEQLFTTNPLGVTTVLPTAPIRVAGLVVPPVYLATFGVGCVLAASLGLFLRYTGPGRAVRAVRMDREAARMLGIDVDRVFAVAFSVGAGLAGVGGVLVVTQAPAYPGMSFDLLLPAFVVVVLGGLGSLWGTALGAVVYGVVGSVATAVFGIAYSAVVALVAIFLVLLVRPQGLLGNRFYG